METGKHVDKQKGTRKGRENAKGVKGIYIGDYYYGVYRGDYNLFNKVYIDFMVIRGTPSKPTNVVSVVIMETSRCHDCRKANGN